MIFLFFMALGLLMIIKPLFFWLITESWKLSDATEPLKLFIWSTRFGGFVFLNSWNCCI